MNDDTNSLHPWIEPGLEARLTALVLGEASDFERDELERLVADRPELGLYRKRLEAMHRMLREVAKGESAEEQGEWKLSPERRTALLARLRGEGKAEEKVVVMSRPKRRVPWGLIGRIAACFAVIGLVLSLILRSLTTVLGDAERRNRGGNTFAYFDSGESSAPRHWDFREESRNSSAPQLTVSRGAVVTDSDRDRDVGGISGAGRSSTDEFVNGRSLRRESMVTEPPATPQPALSEAKEAGLADLAIRTPVTTTATTAPPAEPPGMNRSAQTNVANGTVALRSASGTIHESSDGRPVAGRQVVGEASGRALGGANTYTGGTSITAGGVLAITSPEPVAAPPAPAAPVDVTKGYAQVDTKTRGTTATTDGDADGSDRAGLADTRAETRAKVQLGLPMVEEGRMRSLQSRSETTGTLAAVDAPAGGGRELAEKEVAELAEVEALKAMPESEEKPVMAQEKFKLDVPKSDLAPSEMPRKAGKADDFGTVTFGQTGAAAPAPAAAAKPMPVAAAAASGPVVAGEPVVEQPLAKVGAGTLALNSGVTEFDGFVDVEGKKEAASNRSAARGDLDFAGDTQAGGGAEATGDAERYGRTFAGGGTAGSKDGKAADEYDFIAPVVSDPVKRRDAEVEEQMTEASRMVRLSEVDKSVRDILSLTSQLHLQPNAGGFAGSGRNADEDLSTLYASTETEGRFRTAPGQDRLELSDKRRKMLEEISASWESPAPAALAETSPSAEPFSTFSLHVSDVSFQLAKSSLASGKWPEAEKIRIEEFVNAFDYGDPVPSMGERVACRIDQGAHPFLQQRNLVRIALRTAEAGRSSGTPLRLTLLLDSSGSMERPDRRATLTRAVATLAGLLGENDRITLVSFARQPRLVADAVAGNEAMKLAETVAALPSEGGTNLEAALELAFEKAREHQEANAQNRIVLLTDGAANLGDAKAESLGARVEMMRDAGIAFDAAGFGAEGLNDEILEALTRKGDGRYYLLDRPEDAGEAFAEQIAGALRPAAKNVKVQVEFNPDRVKSYKLLGFEKHRLATEDFRNDAVDAAELAAAEAGVAVYQVEPDPAGEGDLGAVSVRFRDLESGEMVERRWALPHLAAAPAADQGGGATHLAIVASQFAAKLAGGPVGDVVDLGELARLAATLPDSERVKELRTMIEQARGLEGGF